MDDTQTSAKGSKVPAEGGMTALLPCGFLPMETAPRDGTEIEILFQHRNYYYAEENKRDEWQQVCRARWTDFNTGGWVWHGIAGVPICWRPAR